MDLSSLKYTLYFFKSLFVFRRLGSSLRVDWVKLVSYMRLIVIAKIGSGRYLDYDPARFEKNY